MDRWSDAIEKQLSRQSATIRRELLEMLNSLQTSCLADTRLLTEREDNLMSCITLQTRTGPEEYQVSDLDEVVWWNTENGIKAVGYMDAVSGLISENDLETCRIKRPEIVREILQQQASGKPKDVAIQ